MPAADDDEDLDAGFMQTDYRVPQDVGSAAERAKSAKSSSASSKGTAQKASSKNDKSAAKAPTKQKSKKGTDQKRPVQQPERDDS
jgi:hypothetical protein